MCVCLCKYVSYLINHSYIQNYNCKERCVFVYLELERVQFVRSMRLVFRRPWMDQVASRDPLKEKKNALWKITQCVSLCVYGKCLCLCTISARGYVRNARASSCYSTDICLYRCSGLFSNMRRKERENI